MTRPLPPDFATIAKDKSVTDLMRHYRASVETVRRWILESGLPKYRSLQRPVPADFTTFTPGKSLYALSLHYRAHAGTIRRWFTETGLERPQPRFPSPRAQRPPQRRDGYAGPRSAFVSRLPKDRSIEGQAADFLRSRTYVYRCTEMGAADQQGRFWRYGNVVLSGMELVARAVRYGFDADGWRTIREGARA